jgi:hypothetical protein
MNPHTPLDPIPVADFANFGMVLDSVVNISFDYLINSRIEIDSIIRLDSVRNLYIDKYRRDVYKGAILPIESLPVNLKVELWDMAGQYATERERRVEASKIIYLIETMCNNQLTA